MKLPQRIFTFAALGAVLALPLLAGCATKKPQAAMQASQQSFSNVTSINSGEGTTAILSGPQFVTLGAKAGKTTPLLNVASLNPDCTLKNLNTIKITTQPSHGKAVIAQHEGYSSYGLGSALAACNKSESPGNFIDYTPGPNYVGPDFIGAEVTYANGQVVQWTITVTVAVDKSSHGLLN